MKLEDAKDLRVGLEADGGAGFLGLPDHRDRLLGHPALEILLPNLAVAMNLEPQPLGKEVDDAHTDAVQASRDFIGVAVELPAGVEFGHDDLGGRAPGLLLDFDRNAAPIVDDRNRVVGMHR